MKLTHSSEVATICNPQVNEPYFLFFPERVKLVAGNHFSTCNQIVNCCFFSLDLAALVNWKILLLFKSKSVILEKRHICQLYLKKKRIMKKGTIIIITVNLNVTLPYCQY